MATPYDIVRIDTVASTQDESTRRWESTGSATLVIADHQTSGRGRQGRTWTEPTVGVFASLAIAPGWPTPSYPILPLCTAVAVRRAINALVGVGIDCKWPNDLLVGEDKCGGILVEASGGRVTVGCGVNLYWPGSPPNAAALLRERPRPELGHAVSVRWVDELIDIIDHGPDAWPHDEYSGSCVTIGRAVDWSAGSGVAVGVAPTGELLVDTPEGSVALAHGDVHLRAPS